MGYNDEKSSNVMIILGEFLFRIRWLDHFSLAMGAGLNLAGHIFEFGKQLSPKLLLVRLQVGYLEFQHGGIFLEIPFLSLHLGFCIACLGMLGKKTKFFDVVFVYLVPSK